MYIVIVDNIKNEFNVLGFFCMVFYGKKKWVISYIKKW